MTGDDILFFCCLVVSFSSGAVVMAVCGCAVFVIRVVMTRILFCEMVILITDILYYRYYLTILAGAVKVMFCLELGVIFFSGDFKPQNIEPQMVILFDSCVFDLFFGD